MVSLAHLHGSHVGKQKPLITPTTTEEIARFGGSSSVQSTLCTPSRSPSLFNGEETRVNGRRRFANCTIKGVNSLAR